MQRLEVSGAVRPIYGSLGVKRLKERFRTAATWVVYIPNYSVSIKIAHFSKIYYRTSLQDGNRRACPKNSRARHVRNTKPIKCTLYFLMYSNVIEDAFLP